MTNDKAKRDKAGRLIAQRLFPLEGRICEEPGCTKPATHRHHIDFNPMNNRSWNIEVLCPKHHGMRHRGRRSSGGTRGYVRLRGFRADGSGQWQARMRISAGRQLEKTFRSFEAAEEWLAELAARLTP